VFLVFGLFGCTSGVLTTEHGSVRRVVVANKNGTSLYDSSKLNNSKSNAKQWDILFLLEDDKNRNYYKVSKSLDDPYNLNNVSYIIKKDVFEWNSYFCLGYKNSPHQVNRQRVKYYRTINGLKNKDSNDVVIVEKKRHRGYFTSINAKPILKEEERSIYHVATLYDDIEADGSYVFKGNYGVGYVTYNEKAHRLYRYVSKQQFGEQLRGVTDAMTSKTSNLNPNDLDEKFDRLAKLINQPGKSKLFRGVKRIKKLFENGEAPVVAQRRLFDDRYLKGQNSQEHKDKLIDLQKKMVEYYEYTSNWNQYGYAYIPAEWIIEEEY
jgi:hypothetical protein